MGSESIEGNVVGQFDGVIERGDQVVTPEEAEPTSSNTSFGIPVEGHISVGSLSQVMGAEAAAPILESLHLKMPKRRTRVRTSDILGPKATAEAREESRQAAETARSVAKIPPAHIRRRYRLLG